MEFITLHNTAVLPALGFGTLSSSSCDYAQAIQSGLRHFLIPFQKDQQKQLKEAIQNSGLSRDEYVLSAILTQTDTLPVHNEFKQLCKAMDTDYIDGLLTGWHSANTSVYNDPSRMIPVWSTMENIYKRGDTRIIGIHDFTPAQLEALLNIVHIAPIVALLDAGTDHLPFAALRSAQAHNIQPILHLCTDNIDDKDANLSLLAENHATDVHTIMEAWLLNKKCALISDSVLKETALRLSEKENLMLDALAEED